MAAVGVDDGLWVDVWPRLIGLVFAICHMDPMIASQNTDIIGVVVVLLLLRFLVL